MSGQHVGLTPRFLSLSLHNRNLLIGQFVEFVDEVVDFVVGGFDLTAEDGVFVIGCGGG